VLRDAMRRRGIIAVSGFHGWSAQQLVTRAVRAAGEAAPKAGSEAGALVHPTRIHAAEALARLGPPVAAIGMIMATKASARVFESLLGVSASQLPTTRAGRAPAGSVLVRKRWRFAALQHDSKNASQDRCHHQIKSAWFGNRDPSGREHPCFKLVGGKGSIKKIKGEY
jgi:hypothetical protein